MDLPFPSPDLTPAELATGLGAIGVIFIVISLALQRNNKIAALITGVAGVLTVLFAAALYFEYEPALTAINDFLLDTFGKS